MKPWTIGNPSLQQGKNRVNPVNPVKPGARQDVNDLVRADDQWPIDGPVGTVEEIDVDKIPLSQIFENNR